MTQHTWLARRYGSDAERPRLPVPLGRAEELFPTETARVHSPAPLQIAVFAVVTVFTAYSAIPKSSRTSNSLPPNAGKYRSSPSRVNAGRYAAFFPVTRVNVSTISLGEMMSPITGNDLPTYSP